MESEEGKVVTRQPAPSAHYCFAGLGKGVEFQDSWARSKVQLSEASRALAEGVFWGYDRPEPPDPVNQALLRPSPLLLPPLCLHCPRSDDRAQREAPIQTAKGTAHPA